MLLGRLCPSKGAPDREGAASRRQADSMAGAYGEKQVTSGRQGQSLSSQTPRLSRATVHLPRLPQAASGGCLSGLHQQDDRALWPPVGFSGWAVLAGEWGRREVLAFSPPDGLGVAVT